MAETTQAALLAGQIVTDGTFPVWLNMMPVDEVMCLVRGGSTLAKEYVAYCDQIDRAARKNKQRAASTEVPDA